LIDQGAISLFDLSGATSLLDIAGTPGNLVYTPPADPDWKFDPTVDPDDPRIRQEEDPRYITG
jgi:hypothetical protein